MVSGTPAVERGELRGVAAFVEKGMHEEHMGVLRPELFAHSEPLRVDQPQPD